MNGTFLFINTRSREFRMPESRTQYYSECYKMIAREVIHARDIELLRVNEEIALKPT